MTNSHLIETFESWVKGAPEIEVHMLGQAGATDSLTTYSCAGAAVGRLLLLRPELAGLERQRAADEPDPAQQLQESHPNQNLRVFLVEDDDTPCQIKVDPARFANLIKAVEAAYPLLTGGRDTTSGELKIFKKANAIQRILKALASVIKTNDELIGNAVESAVVGEAYPNANWVIKGDGNRTNGWVKLVMK